MSERIMTRPFQGGDKCEASWPPVKEPGEIKGGVFWIDDDGERHEGYRPRKFPVYGRSAAIRTDTCAPFMHPATGQMCDSTSRGRKITKACGFEDRTDAPRVADNVAKLKNISEDDYIKDVSIAREMCLAGTAPLTEYDKEVCKKMDENLKNRV